MIQEVEGGVEIEEERAEIHNCFLLLLLLLFIFNNIIFLLT